MLHCVSFEYNWRAQILSFQSGSDSQPSQAALAQEQHLRKDTEGNAVTRQKKQQTHHVQTIIL